MTYGNCHFLSIYIVDSNVNDNVAKYIKEDLIFILSIIILEIYIYMCFINVDFIIFDLHVC